MTTNEIPTSSSTIRTWMSFSKEGIRGHIIYHTLKNIYIPEELQQKGFRINLENLSIVQDVQSNDIDHKK